MSKPEEGIHVYPLGDLKEHRLDPEGQCWCMPEDIEGVWVHNSMDRREHYEDKSKMH